ncbi:uncharacterized protein [Henckelia pumila]|uniref:uncharacterized protein n=1 Tax=Henckelia pumila TaxID=405737 RepID=UPI003C6DDDD9
MACATTSTRHPFTLFNLHNTQPQTLIKTPTFFKSRRRPIIISTTSIKSTHVSDEDKSAVPISEEAPTSIDARRLEEKFAVINTGIYECRSCGYKYDQGVGDPSYPIPSGLPFERLPDDWRCPTCGASQSFFESKRMEIAGFAQNQQFGLGGNALTSGQKAVLIYGSLLLAFALFLSGYFLQ